MTTTAPEHTQATNGATVVDLSDAVPDAPKRRGRPKGSKNKPKAVATRRTATRRTATPPAAPRTPRIPKEATARACLIETTENGTQFTFIDESGAETMVRTIPNEGWILDRR